MASNIDVQLANSTATLTLNRPEVRNTIDGVLVEELGRTVDELAANPDVRVVVLTGSGELAFCAGIDHGEREDMNVDELRTFFGQVRTCFDKLARLPQPVIAAVNGFATGLGTELALCADFRICAQSATLGITDVRFGVVPAAGGIQRLVRLVGIARAKELILTGRRVSARDAYALGLCNHVVPDEELATAVRQWTEELEAASPLAIAAAKRIIEDGFGLPLQQALDLEFQELDKLLDTNDRREAVEAFAEKRNPNFTGT